MMCKTLGTSICVGFLVAVTSAAGAQEIPDTGGKVWGSVGGSFGDTESAVLSAGGAGIRVTEHLGLDFEIFHATGLELPDQRFIIQELTFAPPIRIEREAALTSFLTTLHADFPVGDRLIPFVAGGGGVGRLSETISYDLARATELQRFLDQRIDIGRPLIFPPPDFTVSETGLVLTLGGGLDIRLWKGLGVGGGARWVRLLTDRGTFDFLHVASRVSYRF